MCLHISSRLALRWLAVFAARPRFCTSSRSLANSSTQAGVPPPPPSGEAMGGGTAPTEAGAGEADGARAPGHGAVAACGGLPGHGSVCAPACAHDMVLANPPALRGIHLIRD